MLTLSLLALGSQSGMREIGDMKDEQTTSSIKSRGLNLSFLDRGNPGGPVLLFLHGLNDHSRTFDDLIEPFLDGYRVVTPDLRGHGDSGWAQGSGYSQLDYLYDLHRLVSELKLAPLTLVGHSLGGAVVALLAGLFPSMVDRLILMEAMGLWVAEEGQLTAPKRVKIWIEQLILAETKDLKTMPSEEAAYLRMHEANPNLTEKTARHLASFGVKQNTDDTYSWKYDYYTRSHDFSLRHEESIEIWKEIKCPVLAVNAKEGLSHRIGHNDTSKYFEQIRLEILDEAGHWIFHDQQIKMQNLIKTFIESDFD